MSGYRLLVFDWDGTLADSTGRIIGCARAAIAELELPERADADIRATIGLSLDHALALLYPDRDVQHLSADFRDSYRRSFFSARHGAVPLYAGVISMLEGLRGSGYRLAVATGKSRAGLDRDLDAHALGPLFDATRCADEARSKPHPEMLLAILEDLGRAADEALMIGDTAFDLLMARDAGVDSVAVVGGAHERERLLELNPLTVLDSIDGLPGWLGDRS